MRNWKAAVSVKEHNDVTSMTDFVGIAVMSINYIIRKYGKMSPFFKIFENKKWFPRFLQKKLRCELKNCLLTLLTFSAILVSSSWSGWDGSVSLTSSLRYLSYCGIRCTCNDRRWQMVRKFVDADDIYVENSSIVHLHTNLQVEK